MNKKEFFDAYDALQSRVDALTAINAELLAALEEYVNGDTTALPVVAGQNHKSKHVARFEKARAAITKARGQA